MGMAESDEKRGAASSKVAIDSTENTVKLDPSNNGVKIVSGAVEVTKLPPVTLTSEVKLTGAVEVAKPVTLTPGTAVEVSKLPGLGVVTVTPQAPIPVHVLSSPAGVRGLAWAVTADGGRKGFGASTGSVEIDAFPQHEVPVGHGQEGSSEAPHPVEVAMAYNPPDSGVDMCIERISLGATVPGEWIRYHNPTVVDISGNPVRESNRGGGDAHAKGRLYRGTDAHCDDGVLSKVTYTGQSESRDDEIKGTIILCPGNALCWVFRPIYGTGVRAAVEVVWWEV